MNLGESFRLAAASLNANKLRSLLTLLGIIIGIMAVIIIMTLGAGVQKQFMDSLEGAGATNHMVTVHERSDPDAADSEDPFGPLMGMPPTEEGDLVTFDQLEELRAHFGSRVKGVDIEEANTMADAAYGDNTATVGLSPSVEDSLSMRNKTVEFGRPLSERDIKQGRPVAVLPAQLVTTLFDSDPQAALGERIDVTVGSRTAVFTVVGVLEDEGNADQFSEMPMSSEVYVPAGAMERVGPPSPGVQSFSVQASPEEDSTAFQADLQSYVARWYSHNEDYDITVVDLAKAMEGLTDVFGVISAVLSSIGGISLLVGGIGVMNIMLITVTERTREIGIRKALGATNANIRTQFIVESILVCLVGGIIGIVLGSAIGMIGTASFDAFAFPPLSAVLISLVFSLATGVFFGAYPASKAARLQPIEALRYE